MRVPARSTTPRLDRERLCLLPSNRCGHSRRRSGHRVCGLRAREGILFPQHYARDLRATSVASLDYTGYCQRVRREQLAKMMEFEADRMTDLILKDENVLHERDVVLEEFNMRVANKPDGRLSEQIMAALYLNHPYGRPVI